ncbi:MAG TPA: aldehyde dehydrogenase family protein, partial [Acidobacteriota bacterium]|nr:aldehyde dehydrogenase family protein [Acidobacteriota bacterium]
MTMELKNLVGDQWLSQNGQQEYQIVNPADGRTVVARFRYSTDADVALAVQAASNAFPDWRDTPIIKRCRILFHCKELLEQRLSEIATLLVSENG